MGMFVSRIDRPRQAVWPRLLGLALAGALGLFQVGCGAMSKPVTISGQEVLERSPALAVDVENRRGSVLIKVNPKLTAPRITAVSGNFKGEAGQNYQSDLWAKAEIAEADGRAVLTVRSKPLEPGEGDYWLQIAIEVPSCDGLRVRNSDGTVDVRGATGAISIENGGAGTPGGYVYLECGKPVTAPVTVSTSEGDVDVIFPTDSTGNMELVSGNGRLAAIIAWTGQMDNSVIRPGFYSGVLNRGVNPVRVKCAEGEVRLRVGPYRLGNPQIKYYKQWYFS